MKHRAKYLRLVVLCLLPGLAGTLHGYAQRAGAQVWQMEQSGTTADLRGIHSVGGGVAWASGTNGTVLRTEDSGFEWQGCAMPPGAEKLDFRAVWGWDANTAVVLSSGPGALSRVYRTEDGCAHWTLLFTNPEPGGFYDGLLFVDREHGLLIGDATTSSPKVAPVDGGYFALRIRVTADGGRSWAPVVAPSLPADPGKSLYAFPKEGFFAASNSSAIVQDGWLWLGTNQGRVLRIPQRLLAFQAAHCAGAVDPYSRSCGIAWLGWQSSATPLAGFGDSAGIFSLAFLSAKAGMAVGGDYANANGPAATAAWTTDGGQHWALARRPPAGYRSSVACEAGGRRCVAVGPTGSDVSMDGGVTWAGLESTVPGAGGVPRAGEWNALSLPFVVGPRGRIAKWNGDAAPSATRAAGGTGGAGKLVPR